MHTEKSKRRPQALKWIDIDRVSLTVVGSGELSIIEAITMAVARMHSQYRVHTSVLKHMAVA